MKTPSKHSQFRHKIGRKNLPRDHTKLLIIKYLISKDTGVTTTLYELLHHAGISMYDYPYLKKILQEMIDNGWIRTTTSGAKGKEKSNYLMTARGRQVLMTIKSFERDHPILDLDIFRDI